jgi:cyclase
MNVSKSVYCRIGELGDSNNGAIICDDCCVVVDTATYLDQTRKDLENLRKITERNIKFLINTHYHPDHTFGNMYFADIIAHEKCYNTLKERTPLFMERIREEKERFEGFSMKLPNIVFADELKLFTTPEIELTHYGGHTDGSITVYIPEEKVLFSGDLLFAGYHPYMGDADIRTWIESLEQLLQLEITTIIPGHGKLCDKREIKVHIDYLQTFHDNLKDLKKKYSKEKILKNVDLLGLPEMEKGERVIRNVEAQYDKI